MDTRINYSTMYRMVYNSKSSFYYKATSKGPILARLRCQYLSSYPTGDVKIEKWVDSCVLGWKIIWKCKESDWYWCSVIQKSEMAFTEKYFGEWMHHWFEISSKRLNEAINSCLWESWSLNVESHFYWVVVCFWGCFFGKQIHWYIVI